MDTTVKGYQKHKASFLASIKIYPCGSKSNQRNKPARNGIRWAFCFQDDYESGPSDRGYSVCDIWPEFLDENGKAITDDRPLIGAYTARMHIIFTDNAQKYLERLRENPNFYCMEIFPVAEGIVTEFL